MAEYNEAVLWSIINSEDHPHLSEDERKISGCMPLIKELFPGINYYSITGFAQVMRDYVQPVLSKLFPDIAKKKAHQIDRDRAYNIEAFLPSEGYEHANDPAWGKKLDELLSTQTSV